MKNENKDKDFGLRLKKLRKHVRLYQREAAIKVGIHLRALQGHESGKMPSRRTLAKYVNFYGCSKDWLLTGIEPVYQNPEESTEAVGISRDKKKVEYNADTDDFGKAVSGLKEIFDSGDPILIPAVLAGVQAFQIAVRRETQINEQTEKIDALEKECDDLKLRISSLENRLMEGDRRTQVRRQENLAPPNGMERRSGLDRRKSIKGSFNTPGFVLEDRQ